MVERLSPLYQQPKIIIAQQGNSPAILLLIMDIKQPHQLNIELPEEIAEGVYANLALINHSQSEFVVDFIRMMPNIPKAKVKSRIVITPQHAKKLLFALRENIKKYEAMHGEIANPMPNNFPLNFTPNAQA